MIVTTRELFRHAYGNYAVGAYNINNAEQIMGLFQGNVDSKAPFIVQLSKGARGYTDKRMLEAMIRAADEIFPKLYFPCIWIMATKPLAWSASRAASTAPS